VSSYQKPAVVGEPPVTNEASPGNEPVVVGEPPVTNAASPGNESDGVDVVLLVYVTPWRLSAAKVESL
jgi:hypothetical protein